MKKSICVIALSPIAHDARVLRQIKALSPFYDLTVVGYGQPHPLWFGNPNIRWMQIDPPSVRPPAYPGLRSTIKKGDLGNLKLKLRILDEIKEGHHRRSVAQKASLLLGTIVPPLYDRWYMGRQEHAAARDALFSRRHDAYHANDWNTLPIAAEAAKRDNAFLVLDLHEYAPLEFENRRYWWVTARMIKRMINKYAPQVDASSTVARLIAERYQREFSLDPVVVLSSPDAVPLPPRSLNPESIQLVHHGIAADIRKPKAMIETIALCDKRYHLNLMFMPSDYVAQLKRRADKLAPGRVTFHDPVAPEDITRRIAEFDVGFCLIAPTNYNYIVCLPNKFFDFVMAGLAVCIGPSPSMAELIRQYGFGCIAPSFEPRDLAETLNRTTTEEWESMRSASRKAGLELNAAEQMKKVVAIYDELFTAPAKPLA